MSLKIFKQEEFALPCKVSFGQTILLAKCPLGKVSFGQSILWAKHSLSKVSFEQSAIRAKYPLGKYSLGKGLHIQDIQ